MQLSNRTLIKRIKVVDIWILKDFLKVKTKPLLLLVNGVWAIPLSLLMKLITPLFPIQIIPIPNMRIGHFVADGAEQLITQRRNLKKLKNFYYFTERKSINVQWEIMLRRNLHLLPRCIRFIDGWNQILFRHSSLHADSTRSNSRDTSGSFAQEDASVAFLDSENSAAYIWLESKGWTTGEPFICLLVRDSEFLSSHPMTGNGKEWAFDNWSYHNYRDSAIETYIEAVQWLVDQGVWVIRMGRIAKRELNFSHPKFVDYAFIDDQNDLIDIWLFANATATISTGTGPDMIANIYNRPVLYINFLPLGSLHSWSNSTTVPKHLIDQSSFECAALETYIWSNFGRTSDYSEHGLVVTDLSSDEIKHEVMEFWHCLHGKNVHDPSDALLQKRFWKALEIWPDYRKFHDWRHPNCKVSSTWLKNTI